MNTNKPVLKATGSHTSFLAAGVHHVGYLTAEMKLTQVDGLWFNWSFNGFSRCCVTARGEGRWGKNPCVCPLCWGNESHEKRQSDRNEEVGCWARNRLVDPNDAASVTKSVQMLKLVLSVKVYEDTVEDHNPLWIQILINFTVCLLAAYYNCVYTVCNAKSRRENLARGFQIPSDLPRCFSGNKSLPFTNSATGHIKMMPTDIYIFLPNVWCKYTFD